jgi:hypothetical protein
MFNEGQQQAAAEAFRASSAAVLAREESRHKYAGLNGAQAAKTAGEVFPDLTGEEAGGPPPLLSGQKALGFESPNVEKVELSGGSGGLVESTVPMAIESSPGAWSPVKLGLHSAGGGYEPENPLVAVRLPKRLVEGAEIPSIGVTITPMDAQGAAPAGGEGVQDGASLFVANTERDEDTILKPPAMGLEVSTVLRSAESPEVMDYRVGLPAGASLVQAQNGSGAVEIVKEGATIAQVSPPRAEDATGYPVPVSMTVSGS